MKGCQKKCYNLIFKIKVFYKARFTKSSYLIRNENAQQDNTQSHTTPLQRIALRETLSLSCLWVAKAHNLWLVRSSLVRFLVKFTNSRRFFIKFINFARNFTNFINFSQIFTQKILKISNKRG